MNIKDIEKFNKTKENVESTYKDLTEVYCPYFQEKISFNSKGLEHIKFKSKNRSRSIKDQYIRFKLFHLVPIVISFSRTIQGISHTKNFEYIRSSNRTECVLKEVSYYEFIAILEGKRIRVVIKQIEDGPKYFWSIIPFWKKDKNNNRKMHSSDLELK